MVRGQFLALMNVVAPFGFVTGCYAGDKFMVQATLASMKYYCPSVPICLVVDGTFDVSDLEREYDLIILRVPELPSAGMRKLISGNPRAKLAAMWEGPFEFFVWLDSDAIVWGDFTTQIQKDLDFQIFWKEFESPNCNQTENQQDAASEGFKHYYFDPEKLQRFDADFKWWGQNYFCDGTFACRRNAIPFEKWVEVVSWSAKNYNPWPSGFYCMPMMNYLVHSMAQRGELKIRSADLQHVWGHHGIAELEKDCDGCGWHFPKIIKRPRVAHFCGRKPFILDRKAYSRPFTIARLEHYRRQNIWLGAWLPVIKEDSLIFANKIKRRLRQ